MGEYYCSHNKFLNFVVRTSKLSEKSRVHPPGTLEAAIARNVLVFASKRTLFGHFS
jgi:hypothetical protein